MGGLGEAADGGYGVCWIRHFGVCRGRYLLVVSNVRQWGRAGADFNDGEELHTERGG